MLQMDKNYLMMFLERFNKEDSSRDNKSPHKT